MLDRNQIFYGILLLCAATVFAVFGWICSEIILNGLAEVDWAFLTQAPAEYGRAGGIAPILVATFGILAVCLGVSVPIALASGLWLSEVSRRMPRYQRLIQSSLDVLAGTPSIVFGLFGNAFFCVALGLGFSILSGGLTLACMVLPFMVRAVESSLRSVPDSQRQAAAALDLSRSALYLKILLPTAKNGVLVGVVLGTARAMAETAALIFTSGYVDRMPESLLDSGRALSVHIYDLAMNVPGGETNAYASAAVLILIFLAINLIAAWVNQVWNQSRAGNFLYGTSQ